MEHAHLPSFWLKVRKEYIFDNVNEIIEYLQLYPYSPNTSNPDFENTLNCLNEVIKDWQNRLDNTPIYEKPDTDSHGETDIIRLIIATLLALHKKGITKPETITILIKSLLAFDVKIDIPTWENLWKIAIACAQGCEVEKYTINWADIKTSEKPLPTLAYLFGQTQLKITGEACLIDNHGILKIDKNSIAHVAPMNSTTYIKSCLKKLFDIESLIEVEDTKEVKKSDFIELKTRGLQILNSMDSVTSINTKLKDYGPDDIIPIRIIQKKGFVNIAETIDSRYNRLVGKVRLDRLPFRPDQSTILLNLKEGDCILSRLNSTPEFMFNLNEELDYLYMMVGDEFAGQTDYAVFSGQSIESPILQFITSEGLRVMLHQNKLNELDEDSKEDFLYRAEAHLPVQVKFYNEPHHEDANYKLYVQPDIAPFDENESEILNEQIADINFLKIMIDDAIGYIQENLPKEEEALPLLPLTSVNLLSHLLYYSAKETDSTPLFRLKNYLTAAMLSKICNRAIDVSYLMFRINELGNIVAFCRGNGVINDMKIDPRLSHLPQVAEALNLVEIFKNYSIGSTSSLKPSISLNGTERNTRVKKLVEASNSLRNILDTKELDNIKYTIAKTLGAEDEYVHIADNNRTFYGIENISLEFKKSIVFPPKNRRRSATLSADPDLQRWAILKTVCGFLNSRSGGELILGVNDDGYADGVDDDIQELYYQRKAISKPDIDHYRQYVQRQIDYAFREYGATTQSIDITSLNISYEAEINPEGKEILRIKVKPYPYGAVAFSNDLSRPEGYKESYVRKDGMTRELTPSLINEIEKYKLDTASSDSRNVVLLANALEKKTIAILRNYTSASGVSDREVEVYKVWKNLGLILGYDLNKKETRIFKICRAESVELTNRHWTTEHGQKNRNIDPFGMLLDENSIQTIEINLTDYGKLLLSELIPSASFSEVKNTDSDKRWRYTCKVSSLNGIGRFCLGLPREVEIVNGENLKNYLRDMAQLLL